MTAEDLRRIVIAQNICSKYDMTLQPVADMVRLAGPDDKVIGEFMSVDAAYYFLQGYDMAISQNMMTKRMFPSSSIGRADGC